MIPRLRDVLALLEKVAPALLAEPWDNPGLQVGSYSQEITKIFVALDPTLKALRSAHDHNAQLLLTHHPLIFESISRLDTGSYPGNVILESAKSGISIVSAHTNPDVSQGGINDILSELFGLQHVEVIKKTDDAEGAGLGRIGDLPRPADLSVVVKDVKRTLGTEKLRIVGRGDARICRLAIVGGSGGSLVPLASKLGADLLLTGDVSHHHALEAGSLGIALIDGGHFRMEKKAFEIFAERLKDMVTAQGWEITVEMDKDETNPMRDG